MPRRVTRPRGNPALLRGDPAFLRGSPAFSRGNPAQRNDRFWSVLHDIHRSTRPGPRTEMHRASPSWENSETSSQELPDSSPSAAFGSEFRAKPAKTLESVGARLRTRRERPTTLRSPAPSGRSSLPFALHPPDGQPSRNRPSTSDASPGGAAAAAIRSRCPLGARPGAPVPDSMRLAGRPTASRKFYQTSRIKS